jgi:hypothetical protein
VQIINFDSKRRREKKREKNVEEEQLLKCLDELDWLFFYKSIYIDMSEKILIKMKNLIGKQSFFFIAVSRILKQQKMSITHTYTMMHK